MAAELSGHQPNAVSRGRIRAPVTIATRSGPDVTRAPPAASADRLADGASVARPIPSADPLPGATLTLVALACACPAPTVLNAFSVGIALSGTEAQQRPRSSRPRGNVAECSEPADGFRLSCIQLLLGRDP